MAYLVRPIQIRYLDSQGRRVPKGTPGAKKKKQKARKWYGGGIPGMGKKLVPLASDKKAAEQLLAEKVRLAERGEAGLHDAATEARRSPIAEHLAAFRAHLEAKGDTAKQVAQKSARVRAVIEGCGFATVAEIQPDPVEQFLKRLRTDGEAPRLPEGQEVFTRAEVAELLVVGPRSVPSLVARHRLPAVGKGKARRFPRATVEALLARDRRGASVQTANHYLRETRSFCNWLVDRGALTRNPLALVKPGNVAEDRRHDRRNLTVADLGALLNAAQDSADVFRGLTGRDRFVLYLVACGTGFRAAELASLRPASFRLDGSPATVTLPARKEKNRKGTKQPLRDDLAAELRAYLAGHAPDVPLWPGTWHERAAEMLRRDLEAAAVPYQVEGPDGPLFADFHALRHTFISLMVEAGVTIKQAQVLARHSDPRLTIARYSHAGIGELGAALGRLPGLTSAAAGASLDGIPLAVLRPLALLGLAHLYPALVAARVAVETRNGGDGAGQVQTATVGVGTEAA